MFRRALSALNSVSSKNVETPKERLKSRSLGVTIAQWVRYWTVSVMLLLCVVLPEVALTVTVKVPVGVPGL